MTLKIRKAAFVVALGITVLSVNLTFNFDAQSQYEEKMLDELLSTEKNIGLKMVSARQVSRISCPR